MANLGSRRINMRTVTFAVLALLITPAVERAGLTSEQNARSSAPYQSINLLRVSLLLFAPARANVHRTASQFRKSIIDPYQEIFRVAPGSTNEQTLEDFFRSDENLETYIQSSSSHELAMRKLSDEFPTLLSACWSRLHRRLPRLHGDVTIFLLPAPLDTVGGCVRPVARRNVVVFGSEVIAHRLESRLRFDVFVSHELFHLYHLQVNPETRNVTSGYFMHDMNPPPPKLYQLMWLEGLAVHASQILNPHATMNEAWVSKDPITEVEARVQQLSALALEELDSTDKEMIRNLVFDGNETRGIPSGTGYYVGMLVAKHLASHYRLENLADLKGGALRDAVKGELSQIATYRSD